MPKDYAKSIVQYQKSQYSFSKKIWLATSSLLILATLTFSLVFVWHKNDKAAVQAVPIQAAKKMKIKQVQVATRPNKPTAQKMPAALPKFEFYKTLAEPQLALNKPEQLKKSVKDWPYMLQIAALKREAAIESLRDQLALLGFDVFVIHKADSTLAYRVCVGPYRDLRSAKLDQQQLKESHLDSILMRRP